ncbi:MAG: hypothetical protein NTW54_12130 [Bacteroidetes bacterium]|nr:hypothetical protein [Bacteroidota bacterium]
MKKNELLKTKGYKIEKCYKEDGDFTEIYSHLVNNGYITMAPGETVNLRIVTKDHVGNQMQVAFMLKAGYVIKKPVEKYNVVPARNTELNSRKAKLILPPGSLYDTCFFSFYADTSYKRYSYKYNVGNRNIPLQKEITLKIIPLVNPHLKEHKLYLKSIAGGSIGGTFREGYLTASTKTCGTYYIDIDTTPPVITPLNIPNSRNITLNATLKFLINDSQTGVKKFKATANGKYLLFSYDLKYNLITCDLQDVNLTGQTNFELSVEDGCGNVRKYKTVLLKN